MRYYDIEIPSMGVSWTSRYSDGTPNPGALQVEFQLEVNHHQPVKSGDPVLTVYGIPWEMITEAYNFAGKGITIYGGMDPGLPIATRQARAGLRGLLLEGTILRCWGNWIGTEMSLGFAFAPAGNDYIGVPSPSPAATGAAQNPNKAGQFTRTGPRSIDLRSSAVVGASSASSIDTAAVLRQIGGNILPVPASVFGAATSVANGIATSLFGGGGGGMGLIQPLNLIHNLQPNQPLSSAIQETLSRAFPYANIRILISPMLKLPYQDAGIYQSMEQYSQYINQLSHKILGTGSYMGVHMSSKDNTINVWDGTTPVSTTNIDAVDLIGQPTWIDWLKISVKTAMRADMDVGGKLTLPPTLMTISPNLQGSGGSIQRTNTSFTGEFTITKVLHIGDFRSPDSANWSTNFEAALPGSEALTAIDAN